MSNIEYKNLEELLNQQNELLIDDLHCIYDSTGITFKNIIFTKDIKLITKSAYSSINKEIHFDSIKILPVNFEVAQRVIFDDCNFSKFEINCSTTFELEIKNCKEIDDISFVNINKSFTEINTINQQSLKNDNPITIDNNNITKISIDNSNFLGKFYFSRNNKRSNENPLGNNINDLKIIDSQFNENFKLHNCDVSKCFIDNTNFEKDADFYKTKFLAIDKKDIYFQSIVFNGLALFGSTEFSQKVIFEYVTFKEQSHFKNAEFKNGIDLELAIIQKDINFYGIQIKNKKNTSQETYRIIKHQFEKLGNKIAANKYYALELMKRKQNLPKYSPNKWSLLLHQGTSNFSQWWLLSLFWILVVSFVTAFFVHNQSFGDIINNIITFNSSYIKIGLIKMFNYMSILNIDKELIEKNFEIFMLNKLALGYLYYQFVNSFRKDVRK